MIEAETSVLVASVLDASALDASVLEVLALDLAVELGDFSSSWSSSFSTFVSGGQPPGAQGNLNSGKSGHLKRILVVVTMFQTTTAPPQPGHQMTGTTVELSSSLLVVIQVFVEISFEVIRFVVTPVGIFVMVDVMLDALDSLLLVESVGLDTNVSVSGSVRDDGREVVLPSTCSIPEVARETDIVPLVNSDPPGLSVTEPRIIPDALPDAVMLGASVRP